MKIRKNNQKKEESFEKVKMAGELCKTLLLKIINDITEKETLNKAKSLIENMIFMSEINQINNNRIPNEYINQNNEIISLLKRKGIATDDTSLPLNEDIEKIKDLNIDKSRPLRPARHHAHHP